MPERSLVVLAYLSGERAVRPAPVKTRCRARATSGPERGRSGGEGSIELTAMNRAARVRARPAAARNIPARSRGRGRDVASRTPMSVSAVPRHTTGNGSDGSWARRPAWRTWGYYRVRSSMSALDAYALILAGGGGTRLWPASRRSRPKQLLHAGRRRVAAAGLVPAGRGACSGCERTLVVTAADQADAVRAELPELPAEPTSWPSRPRATPPLRWGWARPRSRAGRASEAVLAVLPSDAFIGDEAAFARTLATAVAEAQQRHRHHRHPPHPRRDRLRLPAPGRAACGPSVFEVGAFVEKPDADQGAPVPGRPGPTCGTRACSSSPPGACWPRRAGTCPRWAQALDGVRGGARLRRRRAAPATRRCRPPRSTTASWRRPQGIRVVPGDFGWNDVGSWAALGSIRQPDAAGNVVERRGRSWPTPRAAS